jgi:homoserine O-acetyltransferase
MADIAYERFDEPFELERGGELPGIRIAYRMSGVPAPDHRNVVWICHALTGHTDPEEWWEGLVGEGSFFDPTEDCIICANILGSCYGSTCPQDPDPESGEPWLRDFPELTVRDIVNALSLLKDRLGIRRIKTLIGGSLGGQQALEWAIMEPELIDELLLLATNARQSPWGIAFNETQRMAVRSDPSYFSKDPDGGKKGLGAARAIALLSYRNYKTYDAKQQDDREVSAEAKWAATYQQYQGEKLVKRFDAHSYVTLSRAMDLHDVGRGRGGVEKALSGVRARTLVIRVSSDILFPLEEQQELAKGIPHASFRAIDSIYGHDGFLLETEKISEILKEFRSYRSEILRPVPQ